MLSRTIYLFFAILLLGRHLLAYPQGLSDLDLKGVNNTSGNANIVSSHDDPSKSVASADPIDPSANNHLKPTSASDKPANTRTSETPSPTTPTHTTPSNKPTSTPTHEATPTHEPIPTHESTPTRPDNNTQSKVNSETTPSHEVNPPVPHDTRKTPTSPPTTMPTKASDSTSSGKKIVHYSTSIVVITASDSGMLTTKHVLTTITSDTESSLKSQSSSNKGRTTGIAVGVSVGVAAVLSAIGIWIFRKWKLSPSRNFRARLRNNDHFKPPTHSILERESNTVFLRELNE
ncbi:hypothetical protein K493DRAFT_339795 [Basidiobolus meristosporus CBS 931.73]|uniref:Mid2 domain-containing protein n=1 Tax=Basidiobolus meristosporus CBS 931.73 TaxID=1314790 RepID=A0A1Y1XZ30_9FUNG|nr:hypothetical protein K493DRAFT_339795 [Basidiobolus meristosporus CBS 931.73]|eukprot:ORX90746.1 hypothetical protein K493DRAFT_339795 [Basidiobolus meristosporus CBS 931.73]